MPLTYILITSQTLGTAASSVTFSSIDQTYTDLILRYSVRDSTAGVSNGSNLITTNGSAQYVRTDMRFLGSTPSATIGTINAYFFPNRNTVDSAGNTSGNFSEAEIYIPQYTTSIAKPMIAFANNPDNSTSNCAMFATSIRQKTTTPAITSISIAAGTTFIAGSTFYLYGIKNS